MASFLNNPTLVCPFTIKGNEDEESLHKSLITVAKLIVPDFASGEADEISVKALTGGITNALFKLTNTSVATERDSIVIRLFGRGTSLLIDREKENTVFSALSRSGAIGSPTFFGLFDGGRVEGYLNARALDPVEMNSETIMPKVATAVGRLHSLGSHLPEIDTRPMLFDKLKVFFGLALGVSFADNEKKQALLNSLCLSEMAKFLEAGRLHFTSLKSQTSETLQQQILAAGTQPLLLLQNPNAAVHLALQSVICHNDLLSGNILLTKVAEPVVKSSIEGITLIDFEYAAYNSRAYDLANHFCEFAGFDFDIKNRFPDAETRKRYICYYLDSAAACSNSSSETEGGMEGSILAEWAAARSETTSPLLPQLDAFVVEFDRIVCEFVLVSHLFWGSWAVVQSSISELDFDYLSYAQLRFNAFFYHQSFASSLQRTPHSNNTWAKTKIVE